MSKKGFFKGVIVGGIVAGVSALLLAPKSGKETREDIKNKLDTAHKDLSQKLAEAKKAGDAETKQLVEKGERMLKELSRRSADLGKSSGKVGRVASDEAKVLAHRAGELVGELADSTKKVVKTGQREMARVQKKNATAKARTNKKS